jgi:hypothetical protein
MRKIFKFSIVFVSIILLTVYLLSDGKIEGYLQSKNEMNIASALPLSADGKLEDFRQLFETLSDSIPNFAEQKKVFGFDFTERKALYEELIQTVESDFDYFCVMNAIMQDIPSFHTDLVFPIYESIKQLNCYNLNAILSDGALKSKIDCWYDCIAAACNEYEDISVASFKYIDNQYIFDPLYSDSDFDLYMGHSIARIENSTDIARFAAESISCDALKYDYSKGTPYRTFITLNNSVGLPVNIVLKDTAGNEKHLVLFASLQAETISFYSDIFDNKTTVELPPLYSYNDRKNDIEYIAIRNFIGSSTGRAVRDRLKVLSANNVIIDLRGNYGGEQTFATKYIYPELYGSDHNMVCEYFVPSSQGNDVFNNNIVNLLFRRRGSTEGGVSYQKSTQYRGESKSASRSIYYLIDSQTGSSADAFTAFIKEYDMGTIVGDNTGGEGLGDSFIAYSLKNSGFVFIYYPAVANNPDGTNNSVYGTSPDIRVMQSIDSFYRQRELALDGHNIAEYETMLQYDDVLNTTIRLITEIDH